MLLECNMPPPVSSLVLIMPVCKLYLNTYIANQLFTCKNMEKVLVTTCILERILFLKWKECFN